MFSTRGILKTWYIQNPRDIQIPGISRRLVHSENEAYSEPWYIQNLGIFRTRGMFRTLMYSEPNETSMMERFARIVNGYNHNISFLRSMLL